MDVKIEKPKSYIRELTISLPFEDYEREKVYITKQFQGSAAVPGFRKGKTPLSIIQNKFKKEIEKETKDTIIKNSFIQALKDNNLRPISFADIKDVSIPKDGGTISFRVRFQVIPDFELSLDGIEVKYSIEKVTPKEVNNGLSELQNKFTTLRPVQRPAENGDIIEFDYEIFDEQGKNVDSSQGMTLECRKSKERKSLFAHLKGVKPEDTIENKILYPQEFPVLEIHGKEVLIKLTVKEVKEKIVPEINEDFAKMLGLQSTVELRNSLTKQLTAEKEIRAKVPALEKLMDNLIKKNNFEVPEALVNYYMELEKERMKKQKVDENEMRKSAERRARLNILLDRITESEGIDVSEKELNDLIMDEAKQQSISYEELKTYLKQSGKLEDFIVISKREKAYDFLIKRYLKKE